MRTPGPGRILISEPCSWDMDKLGYPYLPYLWGVLKTWHEHHASDVGNWTWLDPIYRYADADEILRTRLDEPIDVLGLSCYTWNWRLQCRIAEAVKARHPECLIVAGGPQPDFSDPGFFRDHPYIDAIAVKDGEITFSRILETWASGRRDLSPIPGLYLPGDGASDGHRFTGPAEVPQDFDVSPYIEQSQYYERMIRECDGIFCATWETNRGCPFRCSFCDWGSNTMSKVRRFGMERVTTELDWLGRNGVSVLFLADANFGMLARDVELAERVADSFRQYGAPTTLSYNNAKNKPWPSIAISKVLFQSGMPYKHMLSIQHTRKEVLSATDRENISSEKQIQAVHELMRCGIPVEVQLILGIPGDTYELWQGCFGDLMEWGIHGQYQKFLYHLLPNAPAASAPFRERWKMETIERCVHSSPHLAQFAAEAEVIEENDIVVSSASYGRDDWVRMNVYAEVVKALHTSALTHLIAHYLRRTHGVSYEAFYSTLVDEWCAGTRWYRHLSDHFAAFLEDRRATEFLPIDELPSYPHEVAAFQWFLVQACLSLDKFFEEMGRYLLDKYPQATRLASLLQYQKDVLIVPGYDSRVGTAFVTDLDWPSYFRQPFDGTPLPDPLPGSGGVVHVADETCTDGVADFPLDWFHEEGEDRWIVWIDRVVLNYSCATRGNFQDLSLDTTATSIAPATGAPHLPEPEAVSAISLADAVEILRDYATLVAERGLDGRSVWDASALERPREQIEEAALVIVGASGDPQERDAIAGAARTLAFFQPGVGEEALPLAAMGPDQRTWGDAVRAEMQRIEHRLRAGS